MIEPRITIYTPESLLAHPRAMLCEMIRDLIASGELGWRLAVRDISANYRQTFLGFLWAIILPLANTLVWIFLSRSGVVTVSETALPYPVYVFTGTMLWAIFMDALHAPLHVTTAAKGMLTKINFAREALILAGIYQTLFNTGIKVILMIVTLLALGFYPGWNLILFPLGILSLILVGTALGLLITPVGLLYTDIGKAIPLLMQFLMYFTPVVFPMPKEGWTATLFQANPLTPLILSSRDWLTGFSPEYVGHFLLINAISIILLMIFWVIYRLAMPILIERMGS